MAAPTSSPRTDLLVSAYLDVAERLGATQETPAPINIDAVLTAAEAFQRNSQGTAEVSIANEIVQATNALADQPVDRQRELFKPLSAAVIKLLERTVPSTEVGKRLFIMHCPMAPGDWIQRSERVANPYYATEMKSCGTLVRSIETGKDAAR